MALCWKSRQDGGAKPHDRTSRMDMLDLMARRRSVPPQAMSGPGPDAEQLRQLLTIASRVPDHGKLGRWRFIVFEGDARLRAGETIAAAHLTGKPDASAESIASERGRLSRAPLVVGVVGRTGPHGKIPEWEQQLTLGAVCMSLSLAANAMGFVTCWLTEWFSYDRSVLDGLGLAPDERMAGFVHIGHADKVPAERERPDVSAMITQF
jgi:nitroreductase